MAENSNWIDSVIGYFSPIAGLRRSQSRRAMNMLRKYEAASVGTRTDGWVTTGGAGGGVNTVIGPALVRVRDRVRDLVRNNPYAARAVSVIEANMIGTGIQSGILGVNESQKQRLTGLWKGWSESLDCDVEGLNNFYGLQAMASRSLVEAGECLIVRRWRKMSDGYKIPVPFQVQVLEGDYIDTTKNLLLESGGYIRQGVEFDDQNRRVAYWLWNQHPGEQLLSMKNGLISQRHDAKDVRHLFRVERNGQIRGISWGAPCVIRLRDFDAYEDAQLLRQKIAACFAGFIRDLETPADGSAAEEETPDRIEAGAMEILPPGKTIEFPTLPVVTNDGHAERVLRGIAMGFGVTYESLTGDLSNVNFSSARMGWVEFQRNVNKWTWLMFIPRFCNPVWEWFLEAADATGSNVEGARIIWTPPRREMIDPTKEVPAILSAIRGGLQTLPEAIREQGYEPEEFFSEYKKSNDLLDKLKITLDSDARKTTKAGLLQPDPSAASDGGDSGMSGASN